MYSVLNTFSEHTYFYISKNITSYKFWLVFKIVESLHCILKNDKVIIITPDVFSSSSNRHIKNLYRFIKE